VQVKLRLKHSQGSRHEGELVVALASTGQRFPLPNSAQQGPPHETEIYVVHHLLLAGLLAHCFKFRFVSSPRIGCQGMRSLHRALTGIAQMLWYQVICVFVQAPLAQIHSPALAKARVYLRFLGEQRVIDDRPQPLTCGHVAQSVAKSLPYPGYDRSGARPS
jgi:hypothetical protein